MGLWVGGLSGGMRKVASRGAEAEAEAEAQAIAKDAIVRAKRAREVMETMIPVICSRRGSSYEVSTRA